MLVSTIIIAVALFGITIYILERMSIEDNPFNNHSSKHLIEDALQAKFKENYLWACDVFGVKENVYDSLAKDVKRCPSLGVVYFTYYYVSQYSEHYPKIERCLNHISDWNNTKQQEAFANEFISIVQQLRSDFDLGEYELLNKYNLFDKNTLTKKFEVDTIQLFKLSE